MEWNYRLDAGKWQPVRIMFDLARAPSRSRFWVPSEGLSSDTGRVDNQDDRLTGAGFSQQRLLDQFQTVVGHERLAPVDIACRCNVMAGPERFIITGTLREKLASRG